jgi:hypothetical protein
LSISGIVAGGGLLPRLRPGSGTQTAILAAAGLLRFGAGATVSPGLYLAGFSLPPKAVGRIFAPVELVRPVANFILAPVMLQVARVASDASDPTIDGIREVLWIALASTAGGVDLPRPDIVAWTRKNRPAIGSPTLAETLRRDDRPA